MKDMLRQKVENKMRRAPSFGQLEVIVENEEPSVGRSDKTC
jgi:hypothetical protein